ncbi:MAG: hypothetical protein ACTSPY_01975 [Candidatus Helarchaeota archaeon]
MSVKDEQVADEIVKLIKDAYNPRETRESINKKFPEYNDNDKLKRIIPIVLKKFDKKKQAHLKKTEYLTYVLIAGDDIIKRNNA